MFFVLNLTDEFTALILKPFCHYALHSPLKYELVLDMAEHAKLLQNRYAASQYMT